MIIENFLAKLITTLIPFIVPACLIASFIMNHGGILKKSKSKNNTQSQQPAKAQPAQQVQTNKNEQVETQKIQQPDVTGSIIKLADEAEKSEKTENPYEAIDKI